MKRTKIVIGNWKMNLTVPESSVLLEKYKKDLVTKHTEVVICPGYLDIYSATEILNGTEIGVGSQDAFYEDEGALTGEVSAHQLKGFVEYAIIGHSERRRLFGETDKIVAKKAAACIRHNITPIVCVGENLHENQDGLTNLVIAAQAEASLADLTSAEIAKIVIAYEPVWAIGTGHVCEPKKADDVIKKIRNLVKVLHGEAVAEKVRIVYGGSLNDKNTKAFLGYSEIDGFLVGGSSLQHDVFKKIVEKIDEHVGGHSIKEVQVRQKPSKKTQTEKKNKPETRKKKK